MLVALLGVALAAGAQAELVLEAPRDPIAVLLVAPGAGAGMPLLEGVLARLRAQTALGPEVADAGRVAPCKGDVACMVREVPGSRFLLVLSWLPGAEGSASFAAALVDAERARAILAEPAQDADALAARVRAAAVLVKPAPREVRSDDDLAYRLDELLNRDLKPALARAHAWGAAAKVTLVLPVSGFTVTLDGRALGEAAKGRTEIAGVAPGRHHLALERARWEPIAIDLDAAPGAAIEMAPEVHASGAAPVARRAALWGGLAVAAAGVAVTAYAVAAASSNDLSVICVDVAGSDRCTTDRPFLRSGFDPGAPVGTDPNGSGVLVAPLGLSLLAAGGIWAGGVALFGEDDDVPWLPLVAGVAAGALTYGLAAALDGSSAFDARQ